MRHLRPKIRESIEFFQSTDPIVFVLFICLFLFTVSKRVLKEIVWKLYLKVLAYEAATN